MTLVPLKSRDDAWGVFTEFTQNESLVKHGLAVETIMQSYACKYGHDTDIWGMAGMLHDFDYERYPDVNEHAIVGGRVLTERGYPEEVVYAVTAHNSASGLPRLHLLDKVLFAVDELSGLITATALVRPTKSIYEVDAASVKKKMKDKAFARNVSREDILSGVRDLEVDMEEHIAFVIRAMQDAAPILGLQGTGERGASG
ncbi:MAG: HDIG domain-containing protein [Dehalococcoidia bacterium]|nr:HDIG domain-containing protein [Dehalococcoidia bacterium]